MQHKEGTCEQRTWWQSSCRTVHPPLPWAANSGQRLATGSSRSKTPYGGALPQGNCPPAEIGHRGSRMGQTC